MPSISVSIASAHRPHPEQRPSGSPAESIRNHVQSLAAAMDGPDGPTHPQDFREIFEKFKSSLTQEGAWENVQHLFVPDADKHELLDALAHCHFSSFELGDQYLNWRKGSAHLDSCIRCVLGKLTSEARDSMVKDFPILMRGPELAKNTAFLLSGFPSLVLTLSEIGLRLPLDTRHAGNFSGDGGLRTQETEQLLARIRKEEAKQNEIAPDGASNQPPAKGFAPNTDDWLTERLRKFQPRFSARRDSALSLNGEVEVDKELIECRHIARLWEEDFLRTAGKPTYETLNSPAVLQEAARPVLRYDESYHGGAASERLDAAQYWMSNDWGQVLTDNFNAMSRQAPRDGAVCRTLYLLTPNHAMAVGLKIKGEADARRYVVQLYDPNMTVAHQRSAITSTLDRPGVPAEIRTLKPGDFLPEKLQKDYLLIDAENRPIPAIFAGEKVEPGISRFTGDLPVLQEQVMYSMLAYNLPEQLHAYTDQLKLADDLTRMKILTGKGSIGKPGLFLALERGHTEVVEALGDILKACQPPLSPAQLMTLLEAKTSAGTPGLNGALWNEHAETVEAFGELLKTCQPSLSTAQILELLSATDPVDHTPGLHGAFRQASSDTIAAFGRILTTYLPALSSERLTDLLLAKDGNGVTGLNVALESEDAATVRAFGEILKTCQPFLLGAQLQELLFAKDSRGELGLPAALRNLKNDMVEAYGTLLGVWQPSLSPRQLIEIFFAKNGAGTPELHLALQDGDTEAVKGLGQLSEHMRATPIE